MIDLRRRLFGLLIVALAYKCRDENAADRAREMFVDYGYDECPTCRAARLREAWVA